jgi:hypothetical protein
VPNAVPPPPEAALRNKKAFCASRMRSDGLAQSKLKVTRKVRLRLRPQGGTSGIVRHGKGKISLHSQSRIVQVLASILAEV